MRKKYNHSPSFKPVALAVGLAGPTAITTKCRGRGDRVWLDSILEAIGVGTGRLDFSPKIISCPFVIFVGGYHTENSDGTMNTTRHAWKKIHAKNKLFFSISIFVQSRSAREQKEKIYHPRNFHLLRTPNDNQRESSTKNDPHPPNDAIYGTLVCLLSHLLQMHRLR